MRFAVRLQCLFRVYLLVDRLEPSVSGARKLADCYDRIKVDTRKQTPAQNSEHGRRLYALNGLLGPTVKHELQIDIAVRETHNVLGIEGWLKLFSKDGSVPGPTRNATTVAALRDH